MGFHLEQLEDLFCSPRFTTAIGDFLSQNASELEFKPLEEEQPLKNFDIFKEYCALVERQLEAWLLEQGTTSQAVYEACATAQAEHSAAWMTCIDYLQACTTYEDFMQLAYDHHGMSAYEPDEDTAWEDDGGDLGDDGQRDPPPVPLDAENGVC